MHIPEPFLVTDPEVLYQWIEDWSFGKLVTSRRGKLEINDMPFYLDREKGELLGHMARANGQWQTLLMVEDLLVIFDGPHGYVSPTWYSQPDGVPTWNYITLQVSGKAELIKTESESFALLERLSQANEARYAGSWSLDQLDEFRVRTLMKQIVFFRIKITSMEGKAKLSQNRSKMDRVGVIQKFSASPDSQLQTLSRLMKADLKP
ncbi:FMN-binding negative transcriptional regulator [Ketobacter sp. MCCC 1A13808]|uniref:FMN-binding negative transcriptional regulator n=1 Tax=Ketobacter sp. MCCC 1A13808 TaxID=2602738 RepID=UPI0012EB10EA|nr:FMN-binding negative transcriptional regulator [Ketobacter sp. MCCC 1A13808]MVF11112.1 FMN-binding negative transcriptional regulator [Ketobacter sp. MCCC 1A13808]